jgi:hypothetical protein
VSSGSSRQSWTSAGSPPLRATSSRKQTGLRLDLERYLRYYNTDRAHTGRWTRGRTPEAVLGKAKLWHKNR